MPEKKGEAEMEREMFAGSSLPGSQQSRWHYRSLAVEMSFSWAQVPANGAKEEGERGVGVERELEVEVVRASR